MRMSRRTATTTPAMRPTSTTTGADGCEGGGGMEGVEGVVTGCRVEGTGRVGVVASEVVVITSDSTVTKLVQTVYTPENFRYRTHQTQLRSVECIW